ncbi:MAG: SPFH domain-containing protein [Dehalococcoidales bacterium]|nr:SPFH domain-containing protein [Dehalococcoidales bacterium]
MTIGLIIFLVVLFFFLLILLASSLFTVEQQTIAIIERFGKFARLAEPGLHIRIPFGIERVSTRQSLRVRQLDLAVETKTKDDVFVVLKLAIQYCIPSKNNVYDAFYKLVEHTTQMNSWVFDVVRSKVPTMKLDEVFENKDEIADDVKKSLQERMAIYGWEIVRALVNDIEPDAKVKDAMNEVNRQQRLRSAAEAQGDKEKILVIKKAEAEAESKRLQGEGIANQRRAIINGYRDSIQNFQDRIQGASAKEVMDLVALTQYFDTLQVLGGDARAKVIFLPSNPGAAGDFLNQIRMAFASGLETQTADTNFTGPVEPKKA